jgi:hypothetical protein
MMTDTEIIDAIQRGEIRLDEITRDLSGSWLWYSVIGWEGGGHKGWTGDKPPRRDNLRECLIAAYGQRNEIRARDARKP